MLEINDKEYINYINSINSEVEKYKVLFNKSTEEVINIIITYIINVISKSRNEHIEFSQRLTNYINHKSYGGFHYANSNFKFNNSDLSYLNFKSDLVEHLYNLKEYLLFKYSSTIDKVLFKIHKFIVG